MNIISQESVVAIYRERFSVSHLWLRLTSSLSEFHLKPLPFSEKRHTELLSATSFEKIMTNQNPLKITLLKLLLELII